MTDHIDRTLAERQELRALRQEAASLRAIIACARAALEAPGLTASERLEAVGAALEPAPGCPPLEAPTAMNVTDPALFRQAGAGASLIPMRPSQPRIPSPDNDPA